MNQIEWTEYGGKLDQHIFNTAFIKFSLSYEVWQENICIPFIGTGYFANHEKFENLYI